MAKSPDYTGTAINIGIIAGVAIALWFLYKWFKGHVGGNGGTLFGGSGTTPGGAGGTGNVNALWDKVLQNAGLKNNVATKMAVAYHHDITNPPKVTAVAFQLQAANLQAKKFYNKTGTNVVINKALKSAKDLNDTDFMSAIRVWLTKEHQPDFWKTSLAGAQINNPAHGIFLERFRRITSDVSNGIRGGLALAGL